MSNLMSDNIVPFNWCNYLADEHRLLPENRCAEKISRKLITEKVSIAPKQILTLLRQSADISNTSIPIPTDLRSFYLRYRPTPLQRASAFEEEIGAKAQIFYKYEGANISGSHKLNTAIAQAYYYKKAGVKHIVTGTGAGQWGSAIAYACNLFGLQCTVFMVGVSFRQKPERPAMMRLFDAQVYESPSMITKVGRVKRSENKELFGSLAVATAEAIEHANQSKYTQFAIGSGENCVLLHQTIIGNEVINQLDQINLFPDYVIACMGAGSNFAGISFPLMRAAKQRSRQCKFVAVEPVGCPKLTRGVYAYDINDFSGITPVSKMYTLGNRFIAPGIHAGGLRYHGTSELLSALYANKRFAACAIKQKDSLKAGLLFAKSEGILPAPESAYAISAAIDIAQYAKKGSSILINVSGHGLFDLTAYEEFKKGVIDDGFPNEELLRESLADFM